MVGTAYRDRTGLRFGYELVGSRTLLQQFVQNLLEPTEWPRRQTQCADTASKARVPAI